MKYYISFNGRKHTFLPGHVPDGTPVRIQFDSATCCCLIFARIENKIFLLSEIFTLNN